MLAADDELEARLLDTREDEELETKLLDTREDDELETRLLDASEDNELETTLLDTSEEDELTDTDDTLDAADDDGGAVSPPPPPPPPHPVINTDTTKTIDKFLNISLTPFHSIVLKRKVELSEPQTLAAINFTYKK